MGIRSVFREQEVIEWKYRWICGRKGMENSWIIFKAHGTN